MLQGRDAVDSHMNALCIRCENQAHCVLKLVLEWGHSHVRMTIVYYVPKRRMRVITRQCSQEIEAETKQRRDQSCEHFKRVS